MMVSKVAVIALVVIVACPILMGYAMNLSEVSVTEYKADGDSTNVTPLLQTGTGYTYASADILAMNTKFLLAGEQAAMVPIYQSVGSNKTSYHGAIYYAASNYYPTNTYYTANYSLYFWQFNYNVNNCSLTIKVYFNDNNTSTYSNVHTVSVIDGDDIELTRYTSQYAFSRTLVQNVDHFTFSVSGTWSADAYQAYYNTLTAPNDYIDISGGYRFKTIARNGSPPYHPNYTNLPDYTRSVLFTVNLSSVSDSNYVFSLGNLIFTKTTTGGVVEWEVTDTKNGTDPFKIYYDQNSSNNTYQIRMTADPSGVNVGSGYARYDMEYKIRYVGAWPDLIGEANYYQSYEFTSRVVQLGALNLSHIAINNQSELSPIMRIDDAQYRAFEYPIINNKTYDPSEFKTNPKTTISDPQIYGKSIEFGGNTYDVIDGNITLGTHKVPVKGLVLSSIPNDNGGYDNKIGNTTVSTTADPSTIRFNGQWSASISTVAQQSYTNTKTEWTPGQFGWDGIDQNFLMVGLLTSLGVFIALGIYMRRTKASLWPLLLVCGGAAMLFFVML